MNNSKLNLAIIVGSVRDGRFGPKAAEWFAAEANTYEGYDVNIVDLADYDFPIDMSRNESVNSFADQIEKADVIVVVAQEYNHSFGGTLKVALDALREEWKGKAVGFVSYGALSGGLRAVEHLRVVFAELHATTIRETIAFPMYYQNLDENGMPIQTEALATATRAFLENLEWWGVATREMRSRVPYGQPVASAIAAD